MRFFSTLLFIGSLLLVSVSKPDKGIPAKLKVEGGPIEGYVSDGVTIFKGVPFAAPPVGELRWKAPKPVMAWKRD